MFRDLFFFFLTISQMFYFSLRTRLSVPRAVHYTELFLWDPAKCKKTRILSEGDQSPPPGVPLRIDLNRME